MKLRNNLSVVLATCCLASSCGVSSSNSASSAPFGESVGVEEAARRDTMAAEVRVRLAIKDGFRSVLALTPFTRASINHLVLQLSRRVNGDFQPVLDGGNPVQVDLAASQLNDTIVIGNLVFGEDYRLACRAYRAPGAATDDLISTTGESSSTDITVDANSQGVVHPLKVRLIDVDGRATSSSMIDVSSGGLVQTGSSSVTILPPPSPSPYQISWAGETPLSEYLSFMPGAPLPPPGSDYRLRLLVTEVPGTTIPRYSLYWGTSKAHDLWDFESWQTDFVGSQWASGSVIVARNPRGGVGDLWFRVGGPVAVGSDLWAQIVSSSRN